MRGKYILRAFQSTPSYSYAFRPLVFVHVRKVIASKVTLVADVLTHARFCLRQQQLLK